MKKTPTILQLTGALEQGGVERGILEVARALTSLGWHSLVASAGGQLVKPLTEQGSQHFYLPLNRRTPWHIFYCGWQLAKLVRTEHVSLIHARSRAPAWAALIASKLTGVPYITTFHGTYSAQNAFKRWYNSGMLRGRGTISISAFIEAHIQHLYPQFPAPLAMAPRGVDTVFFDPKQVPTATVTALREQYHIPKNAFIFLLPGRLTRWKGQIVFIEALSQLPASLPWVAFIVGSDKGKIAYKQELQEKIANAHLQPQIHFASQQDLRPFYALADVVITPSTAPEAFGRIAIEAQAMQTPVIAAAHGGALETVQHEKTGWLVPPAQAAALAGTLQQACKDHTQLHKMGVAGRKWVTKHFNVVTMCEKELAVYRQILKI